MFEDKNFAEIEPIVALASHAGVKPTEYGQRASAWLTKAAQLLIKKRDWSYSDGFGEENDLTFTQREIDFLIDGIERIGRKLAEDAEFAEALAEESGEYNGRSMRPWQDGVEASA